jgi:hypothetical protein
VTRWIPLLLCSLAACDGREVTVEVAIPGPDSVDAPVARLGLVALSYNRDSVLAALEAANPRPVSLTRPLDSIYALFRVPFAAYARAAYTVQTQERLLGQLKLQLDSLARSDPQYDSLYRRFAAGSDSLRRSRDRRDQAQRALAVARNRLGPAMDSLRGLMARWEDSTYRDYGRITARLSSGLGREAIADSTDAWGKATLKLPAGDWWMYAHSWDAWDPNSQWYWNVPVTGGRVVLDRTTGRRIPRY